MPPTELYDQLAKHLTDGIIEDVPNFVEHIFPDECLPLPVDTVLAALTGMRGSDVLFEQRNMRSADGMWPTYPQVDQKHVENFPHQLAFFLNRLGDSIRDVCRIAGGPLPKKKRRWSSAYAPPDWEPLSGACLSDHPPLVLFDSKPEDDEEGWHSALSVAELVLGDDVDLAGSLHRLIHDASDAFFNQDDRRFQVGLTIATRTIRLVLIDHCGVVAAEVFNVHERPDLLVRIVAGLMLSSRPTIGFDTTITTLKSGQRQIKVGQDVYDILTRLSISHDIRGKATVCWHARRNGTDFVIKDNWNDTPCTFTEADMLEIAKDIPGITKLVALETVVINRAVDSTAALRSILVGDNVRGVKQHQRMVLTPFARKIAFFRSKKELISVFIDAVEAHRGLVDKNILHCDVSSNNLMISEAAPQAYDDPSRPLRRGILIDVDGALFLDKIGYWVGLIGTFVFMSSAILINGSSKRHKPSDDLESFVYVLIYICIRYAGPDNAPRPDAGAIIDGMQVFCADHADANAIGRYKKHVLSAKGALERDILPHFSVYFEDLKPCLAGLRDAFTKNRKFTYDAMLDVLRATRDSLPLVEAWSPQDDPVGYGLDAAPQKRARDHPESEGEPQCRPTAPKSKKVK
ncbi:hypothetical protein B0H17DRAFT_1206743 [Mycena rosella]|uniref:Fungal-type protein kinase domain-containing protein n=1 Tax=Mycena rosella TaxID=1033263 RepID=A0AAD7D497_MYCRO|nr:hypothetical protein B0H17DRAFT_1206743 [Mycena rosella]